MENKFDFVINKMKDTLTINSNDYIICAISGGSDSMCLLNILLELSKIIDFNIVCAHVNHNVRKESDSELIFVKDYCENHNVIFESMKITRKISGNFESEARKIRYEFFNKLIQKYNSKYLLTAHHGDDLMETILMRIVRGSNINGYSGFNFITKNDNYDLVRPLIFVTKNDIVNYDLAHSIPWVEDYTNKLDNHTRNRYRKYILPKLKEENKYVNSKFLQFSEELNRYSNYVDKIAFEKYNSIYKDAIIISKFKDEDELIQDRIIAIYLYNIYKDDIYLINKNHLLNIKKIIFNPKPNLTLDLPNNYLLTKTYDDITIIKTNNKSTSYNIVFDGSIVELPNGKKIECIIDSQNNSNFYCKLNSNDITLPIIIRTRKDGDKIIIKNMQGSKKIKDIFIDSKVSKSERNIWPIVTDSNNNIIWLPGLKKSKYDKQITEKYDIILKYY